MRAESLLGSPLGAQIGTFGREETRAERSGFAKERKMESLSVCAIWEIACVRSQISLLLFFRPPPSLFLSMRPSFRERNRLFES